MYYFIRLMVITALIKLGIESIPLINCHSRQCLIMFQARTMDVLKIDWKPISVFPEEAGRFR